MHGLTRKGAKRLGRTSTQSNARAERQVGPVPNGEIGVFRLGREQVMGGGVALVLRRTDDEEFYRLGTEKELRLFAQWHTDHPRPKPIPAPATAAA